MEMNLIELQTAMDTAFNIKDWDAVRAYGFRIDRLTAEISQLQVELIIITEHEWDQRRRAKRG